MADKYGTGHDGQYCHPASDVLINKLGLTTADALEAAEINLTQARIDQYEPDFDDISLAADKMFSQLSRENHFLGLPRDQFVVRLAHYYSELNVLHPFRDGNGRTQRLLFEVISINAGFELRWEPIRRAEWVEANIAAYNGRLDPLARLLDRALTPI